jgi:hypothetical protein
MGRTLLLLVVIVAAFAAVFAVVIGVGALRMSAHVPAAAASGPSSQSQVMPPVDAPAAPPALAAITPPSIPPASPPPATAAAIVLAADAAKVSGPRVRLYTSREEKEEEGGDGLRDRDREMIRERMRGRRPPQRQDEGPPPPVIRGWSQPQDVAEWSFAVPQAGSYAVTLVYNAGTASRRWTEGTEGGRFELTVADEKFAGRVEATGRGYRMVEVGKVALAKGEATLQLRPAEKLSQPLMTLRSVTLYPVP